MKTTRRVGAPRRTLGAPFLHRITSLPERVDQARYPFSIRAFSHGIDLTLSSKVTILVGAEGLVDYVPAPPR